MDHYANHPVAHLLPTVGKYKGDYDVCFAGLDAEGRDLLLQLLQPMPDQRPTAEEALRHPWFASLRTSDGASALDRVSSELQDDMSEFGRKVAY